jgi:hypothetical protein
VVASFLVGCFLLLIFSSALAALSALSPEPLV